MAVSRTSPAGSPIVTINSNIQESNPFLPDFLHSFSLLPTSNLLSSTSDFINSTFLKLLEFILSFHPPIPPTHLLSTSAPSFLLLPAPASNPSSLTEASSYMNYSNSSYKYKLLLPK